MIFGVMLAVAPFVAADSGTRQAENRHEPVKQIDSGALGTDPHRFETAEGMYSTGPFSEFDPKAAQLIAMLDDLARDPHTLPESVLFRFGLIQLTPYRRASQLQDALQDWCLIFLRRINESKPGEVPDDARTDFSTGNRQYTAKNFSVASKDYISALRRFPRYDDARNNLALAQLHLGHDAWAQLEWMILSGLNQRYVPAAINLSVLYERIGMTGESKRTAYRATRLQDQAVPAALFNTAWHHNRNGELSEAHAILTKLSKLSIDDKYNAFYALSLKQMQYANELAAARKATAQAVNRERPETMPDQIERSGAWKVFDAVFPCLGFPKTFFHFGQAGWMKKAGVIVLFLLVPFLVLGVFSGVSPVGFAIFITLIAAWYPFYWGIPDGGWKSFVWPGIYVFILGGSYFNRNS